MCLPSGRAKNDSACGFCLPVLSPSRTITLLIALDGRFENGLHLPHAVAVVAPIGLEKGIDDLFRGRGGGEVGGIGLGKHRRTRWGRRRGRGLLLRGRGRLSEGRRRLGGGGIGRGRHMLLSDDLERGNEKGNQRGSAEETGGRTDQAVLLKGGKLPFLSLYLDSGHSLTLVIPGL